MRAAAAVRARVVTVVVPVVVSVVPVRVAVRAAVRPCDTREGRSHHHGTRQWNVLLHAHLLHLLHLLNLLHLLQLHLLLLLRRWDEINLLLLLLLLGKRGRMRRLCWWLLPWILRCSWRPGHLGQRLLCRERRGVRGRGTARGGLGWLGRRRLRGVGDHLGGLDGGEEAEEGAALLGELGAARLERGERRDAVAVALLEAGAGVRGVALAARHVAREERVERLAVRGAAGLGGGSKCGRCRGATLAHVSTTRELPVRQSVVEF